MRGVAFTPAASTAWSSGLLGWARFQHGDLLVEAAVRLTRDSRVVLSFPARKGRYPLVRPIDAAARSRLERAILAAIGYAEEVAP